MPGSFCNSQDKLGAGEIGIEQKPGLGRKQRLAAGVLQARTNIRRPPILPDDGAMHRPAGAAVP